MFVGVAKFGGEAFQESKAHAFVERNSLDGEVQSGRFIFAIPE
jgi:hypothetical protein